MFYFFFQAEDGIRDIGVTGVQTCALPILGNANQTGVIAVLASDQDGASFAVTPRLASTTDVPVTVTVEVDVATLEKYNEENGLSVKSVSPEDIRFVNAEGEEGMGKISATIKPDR